ncbi:MAG: hypothetical protein A2W31_11500 [Planctomycetes bacterium RBG_16_64_10]|nr:MAG: hypothetical protein A2W31_11500 [Planctomycetes bacterium RBG_16_64_10]
MKTLAELIEELAEAKQERDEWHAKADRLHAEAKAVWADRDRVLGLYGEAIEAVDAVLAIIEETGDMTLGDRHFVRFRDGAHTGWIVYRRGISEFHTAAAEPRYFASFAEALHATGWRT